MTFVGVVDEGAGDAVLVAEGLELGAVVHQAVGAAADRSQRSLFSFFTLHAIDGVRANTTATDEAARRGRPWPSGPWQGVQASKMFPLLLILFLIVIR